MPDRIPTENVEDIIGRQESEEEMDAVVYKVTDGQKTVDEAVITSWAAEIEILKNRYKLTYPQIARACGVNADTIERNWAIWIPMARNTDPSKPNKRTERTRRQIINLAYALKLTRDEADNLLSKHGGYNRLLDMFDEDMVDIYIFEHRDLSLDVGENEYNLRHEAYMHKLHAMDAAMEAANGAQCEMPLEDKEFLEYCIQKRAQAEDCKKATIAFINRYIGADSLDSIDFCNYIADKDLIKEGRDVCLNWRTMPDKFFWQATLNGEKVPYAWGFRPSPTLLKKGLQARGYKKWKDKSLGEWDATVLRNDLIKQFSAAELDELMDAGRNAFREEETSSKRNYRFRREWLILLGLKLNMPRALIDHMLRLSGNNELYAKSLEESWLIHDLDTLLMNQSACFGLDNNGCADKVIEELEKSFAEMKSKTESGFLDMNLHRRIFEMNRNRETGIIDSKDAPLWLRTKYVVQNYDPDW